MKKSNLSKLFCGSKGNPLKYKDKFYSEKELIAEAQSECPKNLNEAIKFLKNVKVEIELKDNGIVLFDVENVYNTEDKPIAFGFSGTNIIFNHIQPSFSKENPQTEKELQEALDNDDQSWVESAEKIIMEQIPGAEDIGFKFVKCETPIEEYKKTGKLKLKVNCYFEMPISSVNYENGGVIGTESDFGHYFPLFSLFNL